MTTLKNVDKTIDTLCEWIQKVVSDENYYGDGNIPEMTKALAKLVAARANAPLAPKFVANCDLDATDLEAIRACCENHFQDHLRQIETDEGMRV